MTNGTRLQVAVRAVWKQSYACYDSWPPCRREEVMPAVNELLGWLRGCADEDDLAVRYWLPGDPAGAVLQRSLPGPIDSDDQLLLQEACFWLRLCDLREGC